MANIENLTPASKRTPEERRRNGSKGGKKFAENLRKRKAIREAVEEMLAQPAVLNGKKLTNPADGKPLENMQAALVVSTLSKALKGDVKAASKLVEWLGESNTAAGVTINVSLGE